MVERRRRAPFEKVGRQRPQEAARALKKNNGVSANGMWDSVRPFPSGEVMATSVENRRRQSNSVNSYGGEE
jgi:hypothetical protein